MPYSRLLPLLTATLAALGTLLLGMGQRSATLPMLMLIAAVLSVWLTDLAGWFRLHRVAAAALGVIAFGVVLIQTLPLTSVASVLQIAQLFVYIQIILLFQAKQIRIYWQLLAVSLLQVLVATVFNQDAVFGFFMVVYLFVALAVMTFLFLAREAVEFAGQADEPEPAESAARRWPLAGRKAAFAGQSARHSTESNSHRELIWRIVSMGLGTLVLTSVAFFALPRFGHSAWRGPLQARRMVGYSGSVELGSLGPVMQSPEEVARVELVDRMTQRPIRLDGPIYLHGTILTEYRDRAWSYPGPARRPRAMRVSSPRPPEAALASQRITVEPMNRPEVFYVRPLIVGKDAADLQFDPGQERLLRDESHCAYRFAYEFETTAVSLGRQMDLVPAIRRPDESALLGVPREAVPSLVRLAERWMAEPGLPNDRTIERARWLEHRFSQDERFRYNLHAQRRDFQIDPIEDFIAHQPEGHCEYFATALALMLRSQGIASRIVVGYCSDEFNPLGRFYQVRQLHAHTWVEAYVPPDRLPGRQGDDPRWRAGGWLRLDATPGAAEGERDTAGTLLAPVARGINWLEFVWNNYVMEMDRSRQKRAVYEPLLSALKDAYGHLANPAWWRQLGGRILDAINPRHWNVSRWFSWRGGLTTFILGILGWLFYRGCRGLVRGLCRWRGALGQRETPRRVEVEFYRRLARLLARQGLVRPPAQTPRQFAHTAGRRIARRHENPDLDGLPLVVVEAFYRVRFGRQPLDNPERLAVEQALGQLEVACMKPVAQERS